MQGVFFHWASPKKLKYGKPYFNFLGGGPVKKKHPVYSSLMFYDVLCLKSILGFLLLERTTGVSTVIFYHFQHKRVSSWLQKNIETFHYSFVWIEFTMLLGKFPMFEHISVECSRSIFEFSLGKHARNILLLRLFSAGPVQNFRYFELRKNKITLLLSPLYVTKQ